MSCVKTLQTIKAAVVHSNQIVAECNDISGCYGQQWDFLPAVFYTKLGMISDFSLYVFCNQFQYLAYGAMFICSQNGSPQLLSELNGSYRNVWGSICAAPNLSLVTWEYPFKPQDHTQSPLGHQIQNSQYNVYLRSPYIILLNISSVSDKHFVYHRFRRVPIAWSFCLFIGRSKIANES